MRERKDIEKRDPNKPRIAVFFELLLRKFWTLCRLDILYLIACIPTFAVMLLVSGLVSTPITRMCQPILAEVMGIANPDMGNEEFLVQITTIDGYIRFFISLAITAIWGMGPVTAGYTYIQRNFAREEHAWLFSDFFEYTKKNFWQALAVWVIDIIVFITLVIALSFYSKQSGTIGFFKYIIVLAFNIYTIMHFYIYQCMVTFKLSVKDLFRNSFLFAFLEAPRNLCLLLVSVAIHIGIPLLGASKGWSPAAWTIFILIQVLVLVSLTGFMINFWVYPTIEKYIKEAKKEENMEKAE